MFNDEHRITLHWNDMRQCAWRSKGGPYSAVDIAPNLKAGGGGTTLWTGILMDRKTDLVFVSGKVTGLSCLQDVIQSIIIPRWCQYTPNFIFMDENTHPHSAHVVSTHLQQVGVPIMEWLVMSPDLYPMKHLTLSVTQHMTSRKSEGWSLLFFEPASPVIHDYMQINLKWQHGKQR